MFNVPETLNNYSDRQALEKGIVFQKGTGRGGRNGQKILGAREFQNLVLLGMGYSAPASADILGTKLLTVQNQRGNVYEKLQVDNDKAAVVVAVKKLKVLRLKDLVSRVIPFDQLQQDVLDVLDFWVAQGPTKGTEASKVGESLGRERWVIDHSLKRTYRQLGISHDPHIEPHIVLLTHYMYSQEQGERSSNQGWGNEWEQAQKAALKAKIDRINALRGLDEDSRLALTVYTLWAADAEQGSFQRISVELGVDESNINYYIDRVMNDEKMGDLWESLCA